MPHHLQLWRDGAIHIIETKKLILLIGLLAVLLVSGYCWTQNEVTIAVDGQIFSVKTFRNTVGEVLTEANVTVSENDLVTPEPDSKISEGMSIVVRRAIPLTLVIGGETTSVMAPQGTVADVLQHEGIVLGEYDRVEPGLEAMVSPGSEIKITRVTVKTETETGVIPYPVEKREDHDLEAGRYYTIQQGEKGTENRVVKIIYENGQEVSREVVAKQVVKEPVPQIVAVGTLQEASRDGANFKYTRVITATATAYTETGHRTSTGITPHRGVVAVDPSVIPLGTRLYIDGYGYGTALDTGSSVSGTAVDLYFDTLAECYQWGVRTVKVYILE